MSGIDFVVNVIRDTSGKSMVSVKDVFLLGSFDVCLSAWLLSGF